MKDTFASKTFASNTFASGTWQGLGVTPATKASHFFIIGEDRPTVFRAGDRRTQFEAVEEVEEFIGAW